MNKKIYKGYELAQAVDNGILNLEQKVKSADDMTYFDCTIEFVLKDVAKNIIFENFKLIEDNTEEIEELDNWFVDERKECREFDIQAINLCFSKHRDKINELVKAVNSIRKDKNE